MRALLDTHVFLWWTTEDPKLSARASSFIRDPDNKPLLSLVSAWEIILKARSGRLPIPGNAAEYVEVHSNIYGFEFLDLLLTHLVHFYSLPAHHRDPFDLLLVAQAQVENLPIVTADAQFAKYDVEVIW